MHKNNEAWAMFFLRKDFMYTAQVTSAQWRGYAFGALGEWLQWSPLAENENNYHIYLLNFLLLLPII